jgi:3-oxoacyl-[acyl-carrier-protein] synthase II
MDRTSSVVITGIGLVTPIGNDVKTSWQSLTQGVSGTQEITRFELGDYPCRAAGLVQNEQKNLDSVLTQKEQMRTSRFIHMAMIAGKEAMQDSGFDENNPVDRENFGAYIGVGIGGLETITQAVQLLDQKGMRRVSPFIIPKTISNLAAGHLSMRWNLQGPITSITNACSSSADAVGLAFRLIRDGYANCMLAGGSESCLVPITVAGFGNMRALSTWKGDPSKACRPFDKDRTGFVIGEGAGILTLERRDLAEKRGAKIYAEIVGYAATADAFHVTAMHPDGRGAQRAIEKALVDARIDSSQIGYINAHGTGTPMNDAVETKVLKNVFGKKIDKNNLERTLVSSTKSMTGHLLGAAGGTEIAFTALALKHQVAPPTINLDNPDLGCDLDYVAHESRSISSDYAISNSFGFGGGNAVVVLKRV